MGSKIGKEKKMGDDNKDDKVTLDQELQQMHADYEKVFLLF
ncbi:hypothetical protein SLEP1_g45386 [Rubroshorea leprosula]|uniref:Uncharacterized protein n=1 Tax=Rubroshorea leprosula TaxID=152421 RepID=A0AAV5LKL9_9ROSI|nr:hypothetical protein SLEP1_g45386 [Rubroshorea leprosula]